MSASGYLPSHREIIDLPVGFMKDDELVQEAEVRAVTGADEYYILGRRLADLSASERQRVCESEPVLPGGMQLKKATLELVGTELREGGPT